MEETKYSSVDDTKKHQLMVNQMITPIVSDLVDRAHNHDNSKMESPEVEIFDEMTPKLKGLKYGSLEYMDCLKHMNVALEHHYENNSHHPEHFENGINGMTLTDLVEMIADWKAATLRHDDGDIIKSLAFNKERFGISEQLYEILRNTINMYKDAWES